MSHNSNRVLSHTIDSIFQNQGVKQFSRKSAKTACRAKKKDLELALTVLLVDLACCDQNFDQQEYQIIISGLQRIFGTGKHEIQALVNQANIALANLRGVGRFAGLLNESLSDEQKQQVMDIIDEIIHIDGEVDGFEVYLHHKLATMLGMQDKVQKLTPTNG